MKTFFNCFKTTFLIIGTIIGAGFISGREILQFFGGNTFVSAMAAGFLFFVTSLLLLSVGGEYKTLDGANGALFKRSKNLVNISLYLCMIAVAAASLASIDSLAVSLFSIPKNLPVFSVATLLCAHFCAKKGISGLAFVNALLVPVMLVLTLVLTILKGGFSFDGGGTSSVTEYVCFNMFLSVAVMFELGGKTDKKTAFYSSLISGVITAVYVVLIYGSVTYEGTNAVNHDLPLFYTLSMLGPLASVCFAVVLVTGAFTTLLSAYYPITKGFVAVFGKRGDFTALITVFLISRLGIKNIVAYVYPVAGMIGAVYFVYIAVVFAYKRRRKSK